MEKQNKFFCWLRADCLGRNRAGAVTPAAGAASCYVTWVRLLGREGGTHLLHVLRHFLQPLERRLVGCQHREQCPEAGGDRAEVCGRGHAAWLAELQGATGGRGCGGGRRGRQKEEEGVSVASSLAWLSTTSAGASPRAQSRAPLRFYPLHVQVPPGEILFWVEKLFVSWESRSPVTKNISGQLFFFCWASRGLSLYTHGTITPTSSLCRCLCELKGFTVPTYVTGNLARSLTLTLFAQLGWFLVTLAVNNVTTCFHNCSGVR